MASINLVNCIAHAPAHLMVDGTSNSRARGRHVRDLVAKAGYTKIIVDGFIAEPSENTDARL